MLTTKIVTALLFAGTTLAFADTAAGIKALDAKDYATAYRELKAGADQGIPEAEFYLGVMYARGIGVEQDISEAMRLYQLAAAQGNAQAQFRLGVRYAQGWGVQQNMAEASRWLQMA